VDDEAEREDPRRGGATTACSLAVCVCHCEGGKGGREGREGGREGEERSKHGDEVGWRRKRYAEGISAYSPS
jgi:hypothetical protein